MATWFVGGVDAAHAGLKIVNVCRAVQACRLESFEGEASCAMADHGLQHGLPFHMPQCLDDDATLDLSTSLGLYAVATPNASVMYSGHVHKPSATIPHPKAGARLNILDSGAGETCLHSKCPYIVPGSFHPNSTPVNTANGVVTPKWRAHAVLPLRCINGTVKMQPLRSCLIVDTCKHNLISVGRLALDHNVGCYIAPAGEASFLNFSSAIGDRIHVLNMGILVLPDLVCAAAFPSATQGDHNTTVASLAPLFTTVFYTAQQQC